MGWIRWLRAVVYRWRIARLDRRLDALQAARHHRSGRHDIRQIAAEFDTLAIQRAVLARRLGRQSEQVAAQVPGRDRQPAAPSDLVERYLDLDRQLVEARDSQIDAAEIDRIATEFETTQQTIESGQARRVS